MEKWQIAVEPADVFKYLAEEYEYKLTSKGKEGQVRKGKKYRQSFIDEKNKKIILNDVTNEQYKIYAKKRYEARKEKNKAEKDIIRAREKKARQERNELKKALKQAEKGQRAKLRRIESKKSKMKKLEKEIAELEKVK